MKIVQATEDHIEGIVMLLENYHKDRLSAEEKKNGFVSAHLSASQLSQLFAEGNVAIVAVEEDKVMGVMLNGPWESWSEKPLFTHMIEGLSENCVKGTVLTTENSCLYGPVCLDLSIRGSGIFEEMFQASLRTMKDRYPYTVAFIAKNNPRSYSAHTRKTTLEVTGEFSFDGVQYYYLAGPTVQS